jgi:hypothetical protein
MVAEEDGLLERMSTDRLAGEVPRLPSIEVWQEEKPVVEAIKKAPNVNVDKTSIDNCAYEYGRIVRFMSIELSLALLAKTKWC